MSKIYAIEIYERAPPLSYWLTRDLAYKEALRLAGEWAYEFGAQGHTGELRLKESENKVVVQRWREVPEEWLNLSAFVIIEITVQGDVIEALAKVIE